MTKIEDSINILGQFCSKRDIKDLTVEQLQKTYGLMQVDVMVLFGGSILCGGDILAKAIKNNIAKKYIIVGGAGHTTEALRVKMKDAFPEIETANLSEAEVFSNYLEYQYGLKPDFIECKSTNCGNNITYLIDLLKENNISCKSIILSQDGAMQYRMTAGFRKYMAEDVVIINYAVYIAEVISKDNSLVYKEPIWGMWDIDKYISLLMGEIKRLTDDENGYGPKGKGFIIHVDIPMEVKEAFQKLYSQYADYVREANPLFASKEGEKV